MKEHPILFSAEMIHALLAGRKSVTRRISPSWLKVKNGDHLWVREHLRRPDGDPWLYAADNQPVMVAKATETAMVAWAHHKEQDYCPSIHMPRWASRITLEALEDARMERLWDISDEDARREGMESCTPADQFRALWDTLHTDPGERWEDNPSVIRVGEFRRAK